MVTKTRSYRIVSRVGEEHGGNQTTSESRGKLGGEKIGLYPMPQVPPGLERPSTVRAKKKELSERQPTGYDIRSVCRLKRKDSH